MAWWISIPLWCGSEPISYYLLVSGSGISIPLWCGSEPGAGPGLVVYIKNFNSTMVRFWDFEIYLLQHNYPFQFHYGAVLSGLLNAGSDEVINFNSTMVRFWAKLLEADRGLTSEFQFHYGAVLSKASKPALVIAPYFNSTMVRFWAVAHPAGVNGTAFISIPLWCGSETAWASWLSTSTLISIPLWCGSEPCSLSCLTNCVYFNSTMVRFWGRKR